MPDEKPSGLRLMNDRIPVHLGDVLLGYARFRLDGHLQMINAPDDEERARSQAALANRGWSEGATLADHQLGADGLLAIFDAQAARVRAEDSSEEWPVVRSKSAVRRLPLGSVVLSHRHPYEGWAWQKTAHGEWWAQDSNRVPADRLVAFLGPLTVIYRPEARHGVG